MAGEKILIVDDNVIHLKLIRLLLTGEGFQVQTAEDGDSMFAVLQSFKPKIILIDIQLPGRDGLELTRLLKQDTLYKNILIIALTAYAMKGDEAKALAAGCDDYITKPIDTESFPQIIQKHLRAYP